RELPWLDLKVYSHRLVGENPEVLDRALQDMESAQFILLYRTPDAFWESVDQRLKKLADRVPLIATGGDPSLWTLSSVNLEIAANSYNYIIRNGLENFRRLLAYLGKEVLGQKLEVLPPQELPWEGFYHPRAQGL